MTEYYNGWVITIWQGKSYGTFEYRATKGMQHIHRTIKASDDLEALEIVKSVIDAVEL